MGNKVRIGMIGLGARGKGLLETAYLEHPDAEFVVVCDSSICYGFLRSIVYNRMTGCFLLELQ